MSNKSADIANIFRIFYSDTFFMPPLCEKKNLKLPIILTELSEK